ncbi:Cell division suppressor protein YneA [compost metagenome]
MLKYTTYKSIYDKPEISKKPGRRKRTFRTSNSHGLLGSRALMKIVALFLFITITTTGMVTAFASNGNDDVNTSYETVIVMPGDTLWEIAVNHKPKGRDTRVYIEEIKRFNGMTVSSIQAGDSLRLPEI